MSPCVPPRRAVLPRVPEHLNRSVALRRCPVARSRAGHPSRSASRVRVCILMQCRAQPPRPPLAMHRAHVNKPVATRLRRCWQNQCLLRRHRLSLRQARSAGLTRTAGKMAATVGTGCGNGRTGYRGGRTGCGDGRRGCRCGRTGCR